MDEKEVENAFYTVEDSGITATGLFYFIKRSIFLSITFSVHLKYKIFWEIGGLLH